MEYIGGHCGVAECKQLDFLPFKCEGCKQNFCLDHRKFDDHACTNKPNLDRIAPQCPLCQKYLPMDTKRSYDEIVDQHINSGCQDTKAKKLRIHQCEVRGCKAKEMVPVKCGHCRRNYCLQHRQALDHDCEVLQAKHDKQRTEKAKTAEVIAKAQEKRAAAEQAKAVAQQAKPMTDAQRRRQEQVDAIRRRMKDASQRGGGKTSPMVASSSDASTKRVQSKPAVTPTSPSGHSGLAQRPPISTARRVAISKMRKAAVGSKKVPASQRFHLRVLFRRGPTTRAQDMFFDKNWTIGRVLDVAADQSGLENNNNISTAPKLHIYTVANWTPLPTNVPLHLLASQEFQEYDTVVLEYDSTSTDQLQTAFASLLTA